MSTISVVIPVYKNVDEFVSNLIHNSQYLTNCEIIIVNDDPKSHFPKDLDIAENLSDSITDSITWIQNTKNMGFSPSVNKGANVAHGSLLFLINSDVIILDDSWKLLPPYFDKDPDLFAIGLAQREKGENTVGRNEIYFENGLFHHRALPIKSSPPMDTDTPFGEGRRTTDDGLVLTAFAEGGASLIRKRMWDDLGGMDEAYAPFYWEDVDLSYRANQKGWKSMFAPFVAVKHEHESTIGKYFANTITPTAYRNQLRFSRTHTKGLQKLAFYIFLLKQQIKTLLGRKTLLTKAQP